MFTGNVEGDDDKGFVLGGICAALFPTAKAAFTGNVAGEDDKGFGPGGIRAAIFPTPSSASNGYLYC